jgi:hypothetical protein
LEIYEAKQEGCGLNQVDFVSLVKSLKLNQKLSQLHQNESELEGFLSKTCLSKNENINEFEYFKVGQGWVTLFNVNNLKMLGILWC